LSAKPSGRWLLAAPSRELLATLAANGASDLAGRLVRMCPRDSACTLMLDLSDADELKDLQPDVRASAIARAIKIVEKGLVAGPFEEVFRNRISRIAQEWNVPFPGENDPNQPPPN
jgi:hypothetical protein